MAYVYDEYIINYRVISSLFVMNQLLLQKKYLNNKICISIIFLGDECFSD